MEDEYNGNLDALLQGEGDGTSEDIIQADLAKARELAENYRIRAEKAEARLKRTDTKAQSFDPDTIRKEAEEAVKRTIEQRDLEELEVSDEIKENIRRIAQLTGTSVRKAAQDPYIQSLKEREEQTRKLAEAAENGAKKGVAVSYDPSKPLNPTDFDLSTEEGRSAWEQAKKARKQK